MKKLAIGFLVVLFLPVPTLAAQVFGSLKSGGASVGANVQVYVDCPDRKAPVQKTEAKTDKYGGYSAYVRGSAKCELRVLYRGTLSEKYYIYADRTDPVRYDFELEWEKDRWVLRRR